jgi:hypothetical protein
MVPRSTRKEISASDARYSQRTSDALRFLVAPFAVFFFWGREGLTSPGANTSSGKSQLKTNVSVVEAHRWKRKDGCILSGMDDIQSVEVIVVFIPCETSALEIVDLVRKIQRFST